MSSGRVSFLDQQQNREVTELGLRLKEASENVTINHTGIQQTAKRPIIKKVLETMTAGIDVSSLFGDVIKAASTKDLVQKKLAYMYISTQAEQNADLVILAINTFQNDLQDENPFVRGLALRTLCSMRLIDYVPYMLESLSHALIDSSAYVRKTALISCIKLFNLSPKHVLDAPLVDQLYNTLRDRDPEVVANCIVALNRIFLSEGGMTVDTNIAHYLLQRLHEFNEWHQCLNLLDDRLKHHNSGVQLTTVKIFIKLAEGIDDIQEDVYKRIKSPMLTSLTLTSPEIVYSCLEHIIVLMNQSHQLFREDYKYFYRRIKEPSFVTLKKLEVLEGIATKISSKEIINEISGYITGTDKVIAQKSIESIAKISFRIENVLSYSLEVFMKLLETGIDIIISSIITALEEFMNESPEKVGSLLSVLPSVWTSIDLSSQAGPAFLNLLTTIGYEISEAPYILESLIDDLESYPATSFRLQLLNSTVTLFLHRPAECRGMLAKLFKYSMEPYESLEIRERALFLYRLLQKDIKKAQEIFKHQRYASKKNGNNNFKTRDKHLTKFNTISLLYGKHSEQTLFEQTPGNFSKRNDDQFFSSPTHHISEFDELISLQFQNLVKDEFTLSSTVSIEAKKFKACWENFTESHEFEISLLDSSASLISLTLDDIESVFEENMMMIMASGSSGDYLKFFLYAQEINSNILMLCELKLNLNLKLAKINLRIGYEAYGIIHEDQKMNLSKYSEYFIQYLTRYVKELSNLVKLGISFEQYDY
ncbi:Adaptor protein complex beta subunit [Rhizophagus irregularis]|uniref:Adaptor protein complex beta subunit n=1 Tax=Rhizophagus irregularis TaxID=588596 RepID=A0A2I1GY98_9GLOM|nr:Adaptor protein complex beta subunit [Rhizophagus irregularis]